MPSKQPLPWHLRFPLKARETWRDLPPGWVRVLQSFFAVVGLGILAVHGSLGEHASIRSLDWSDFAGAGGAGFATKLLWGALRSDKESK